MQLHIVGEWNFREVRSRTSQRRQDLLRAVAVLGDPPGAGAFGALLPAVPLAITNIQKSQSSRMKHF